MALVAKSIRVSTRGRIVIPLEVRRYLGIRLGDNLVVVAGDDEVVIMRPKRYAESLRGSGRGIYGKTRAKIDEYIRGERKTWYD